MLMSVLERVREFGLLGALGLGPGRIARLVLIESLFPVCLYSGIGLGLLIHWYVDVGTRFQ